MSFSVGKLFKKTLDCKLSVPMHMARKPEIRASGLPFCGRKFIYKYYEYLTGENLIDFYSTFFTTIGTSAHESIQFWMPIANPNVVIGSWQCPVCHKKVTGSPGPVYCCEVPSNYVEFDAVSPDAPISMHTDGIILDLESVNINPNNVKKFISKPRTKKIPAWIVDYKTSSKYKITSIKEAPVEYRSQGSFYVSAFRKLLPSVHNVHNLDIKGLSILYVNRDNPSLYREFMLELKDNKFYTITCKVINKTLQTLKDNDPSWLCKFKSCRKWPNFYTDCKYTDLCSTLSTKDLTDMFKQVRKHYAKKNKR